MTEEAMTPSHHASMSLRFIERDVAGPSIDGVPTYRKVRILQQMFIPYDWTKHDEFWQDVPLVEDLHEMDRASIEARHAPAGGAKHGS